eukprot:COSAG01_NODE_2_length_63927_cov_1357.611941_52_plen_360_part_00
MRMFFIVKLTVLSCLYRVFRSFVICVCYGFQFLFSKARDLEPAIIFGDALTGILMKSPFKSLCFSFSVPQVAPVHLYDLSFSSPFTFASFKSHIPTLLSWVELGVGGGCFKTILSQESQGNVRPRVLHFYVSGQPVIINALGLPGPGSESFLSGLKQMNLAQYACPFGFSLGGHDLPSYCSVFDEFSQGLVDADFPYYYELNLSCPNTGTGMQVGQDLDQIKQLLIYMRAKSNVVIGVKVSPAFDDVYLCQIAEVLKSFDKVFINCGNTQPQTLPWQSLHARAIAVGRGGVSGKLLFPRTLAMTQLLHPFAVPIMATGGVVGVAEFQALIAAGATLVGSAAGIVMDPYLIPRINCSLRV